MRVVGGPRRLVRRHLPRSVQPPVYIASGFIGLLTLGTVFLSLPVARTGPGGAGFVTSFFTSVSAVTVTGLSTVDTATYWSGFGQVVILVLVQLGGLGISTGAALITITIFRRIGLRARLYTSTETGNIALGDVRRIVLGVAIVTFVVEAATAVLLTARWWFGYDESFGTSAWHGLFHSVMAFNNAGFALYPDSLVGFASDPWILLPISGAIIFGGIGVPVLYELFGRQRRRLTLHTRVTIWMSAALLAYGMLALIVMEWTNSATLGEQSTPVKILSAWFQSVSPRSAGFNSIDYSQMRPESWFVTDTLMFVGGGSVSTAGGIRVTTLAVLFLVLLAKARGDKDTTVGHRRLSAVLVEQALVVTVVFAIITLIGTLSLMAMSDADLDQSLFEVVSALGTTGLSTGLTATLDQPAQVLLSVLMFIGRVGPLTLAAAVALRERDARYRYPEGRVLVG